MSSTQSLRVYKTPATIPIDHDLALEARLSSPGNGDKWTTVTCLAVEVSQPNAASNTFIRHTVAVASADFTGPTTFRLTHKSKRIKKATILPRSRGLQASIDGDNNIVSFALDTPQDVMLELNGSKWQALHLLTNSIDYDAPTGDTESIWYFGPGLNNGSAYKKVVDGDGVNLYVPSNKTVYLAGGAFVTCRINFINVSHSAVRGHGFIYSPQGACKERELGGAIHMSGATNIKVEGVTSLASTGFTLSAGECQNVHVDRYRSFSSAGNGDGIDFFCSSDILIENCFLRNSDDTIAFYSHRWNWYGDSNNLTVRNCTLLPDMAHGIHCGTHGNPSNPEVTSNVHVSNIDILDHEENQQWYQGTISLNAGDENLIRDVLFENIRVERITRGQLINIRTMQNTMWTTAPGRGVQNIVIRGLYLDEGNSVTVNPSMILGYNGSRTIENVTFENLRVGDRFICDDMNKPRWYMVSDLVPLFANEHVQGLKFIRTG